MARGRARQKDIEWVGGVISMPAYVTGEGDAYRPDCLFWLNADGMVLGSTVLGPGEVVQAAAESLKSAIEKPVFGKPHAPARVRVDSAELAAVLRAAHPAIDIVCAATPELDEVRASLREHLSKGEERATYLSPGVDAGAVGAFFRAAAAFYRARPWDVIPSDLDVVGVSIPELGVEDAVLSVIGRMRESVGFVMFSGVDDFEAFIRASDALARGERPRMPPSFGLNFERGADLPPKLRKEIAQHGWEVAGPNAYPWLLAIDEDLVTRPAEAEEVRIAEAVALALPRFLSKKKPLLAAWKGGKPVEQTVTVDAHAGTIKVVLRVPPAGAQRAPIPFDLLGELQDLEGGEEIDDAAREVLEDELLDGLLESPEGEALTDAGHCQLVMDIAAGELGVTIATLDAEDLRFIVFDFIPRHVDVDASQAEQIVEQLTQFYTFLRRKYALPQTAACLDVLAGDAVAKLESALSDVRNFGQGKLLILEGRKAGFDMDTQAGVDAWLRVVQARAGAQSPASRGRGSTEKKKAKRSEARKARRKNR